MNVCFNVDKTKQCANYQTAKTKQNQTGVSSLQRNPSRFVKPQWGTAGAEIKNPPGGSQGLAKVPSF